MSGIALDFEEGPAGEGANRVQQVVAPSIPVDQCAVGRDVEADTKRIRPRHAAGEKGSDQGVRALVRIRDKAGAVIDLPSPNLLSALAVSAMQSHRETALDGCHIAHPARNHP
ncbi:MAG: hypothetical protein E5W38_11720 [Mesorhizobium sp.]|uniref:hypothetical protein n=1 Tax=Mesorhizobium sp. M1E.F.Ca.ET.045.02.1.1 TaxID=2493672 RepID=UPI000F76120D|nr:hypothetical protein [Mesorhizobium sp. M1E.F.Ca.ET.045.02.1.1]AZO19760.1 hypothetical protein EJ070_03140 [Mesorhizobium sp. M1E.F.Ca.ET.045.02.1.1]TIU32725.1 MAG: hypothetical protein E5W38_11720 [Mesorhizobium sp.]